VGDHPRYAVIPAFDPVIEIPGRASCSLRRRLGALPRALGAAGTAECTARNRCQTPSGGSPATRPALEIDADTRTFLGQYVGRFPHRVAAP